MGTLLYALIAFVLCGTNISDLETEALYKSKVRPLRQHSLCLLCGEWPWRFRSRSAVNNLDPASSSLPAPGSKALILQLS